VAAICGPSGGGKSTLLSVLGLLQLPYSGRMYLDGIDVAPLGLLSRARLRRTYFGYLFQDSALLESLTGLQNVMLPLRYAGLSVQAAAKIARDIMNGFCIWHVCQSRCTELSGGEQQRVALARALACRPRVLIADEPTANLDEANRKTVTQALLTISRHLGVTVILATHDRALADRADQIINVGR